MRARGLDARFVDQPLYLEYRVEDGQRQVKQWRDVRPGNGAHIEDVAVLATRPCLHQPDLGPVRIERRACGTVAWLSGGGIAILVERNWYRLAEGRQHLGLNIEANHIRLARADVSHGLSGGGGVCDVGDACSSIGQQAAHKRRVVGRNRRHDVGGQLGRPERAGRPPPREARRPPLWRLRG